MLNEGVADRGNVKFKDEVWLWNEFGLADVFEDGMFLGKKIGLTD